MAPHPPPTRRVLLGVLLASGLPGAAAWAATRPLCRDCLVLTSVKNAAGTGDKTMAELKKLLAGIVFDDKALATGSRRNVKRLADRLRKPDAPQLTLDVKADAGLDAARAQAQVAARVAALRKALVAVNAPTDRISVGP